MDEEFNINFEIEEEEEKEESEEISEPEKPITEILEVEKKSQEISNKRKKPFILNQATDPILDESTRKFDDSIWGPFRIRQHEHLDIKEIEPLYRTPLTNIKESDTHFNIFIELPGLDKNDVNISFQGGILEITGEKSEKVKKKKDEKKDKDKEKKEEKKDKHKEKEKDKKKEKKEKFKEIKGDFIRREYRSSTFYRCFSLPEEINREGIKAKFDNGILLLRIPKLIPEEEEEKQVIAIE